MGKVFEDAQLVVNHVRFITPEARRFFRVGMIYTVNTSRSGYDKKPDGRFEADGSGWVSIVGVPDSIGDSRSCWDSDKFRPLNEDDYKRIREKHGDSAPSKILGYSWPVGSYYIVKPEGQS